MCEYSAASFSLVSLLLTTIHWTSNVAIMCAIITNSKVHVKFLEEMARAEEEGYSISFWFLPVCGLLKKVSQYEWIICQMYVCDHQNTCNKVR